MTIPRPSLAPFAVLAALAAASAANPGQSPAHHLRLQAHSAAGNAPLRAFGMRGNRQLLPASDAHLDGALGDLVRHLDRVHAGSMLPDLQSLGPALRFRQGAADPSPSVLVDAITRGDPQLLQARLVALGMRGASVFSNDVGGWLPVSALRAAAGSPEVHTLRAAMPRRRASAVSSQGDFAQRSDLIRSSSVNATGSGITVGVLSDSFDCYSVYERPNSSVPALGNQGFAPYSYLGSTYLASYATDVSTGNLPAGVNVLAEPYEGNCLDYGAPYNLPFTDEGRAMLQIVHDVAPGASLAFHTADNSEADFANGILALAAAGAKVEADDSGYFDEPFFQDGLLAQAIDTVEGEGVAYFSAAGNGGSLAYENTTPGFATLSSSGPTGGEYLLNFDASGASTITSLPVTIPPLYPGDLIALVLEWDQPYVTGAPGSPGASSQLDLCVTGSTGGNEITDEDGNAVSCSGLNSIGADPVQVLIVANPANAAGDSGTAHLNLLVGLAPGSAAPHRIKLLVEDDGQGSSINAVPGYSTGPTIQGHPAAAGAMAVGAAFFPRTPRCGASPAVLETYSAEGGDPILFSTSGVPLATPIVRTKPDVVAPDGVNTTFFGYPLADSGQSDSSTVPQCQNNASYPSFFGTSAATPHAAAVAALMLQANGALTPAQIYAALRSTASPMGASSPNAHSGWGFIQADMAYAAVVGTGSSSGGSSSSSGGSSSGSGSSSGGSSSSTGGSGSSGGGTGQGGGGGMDLLSLIALGVLACRFGGKSRG
jgi:hypothetical protein